MDLGLEKRVALVTGAARGIGRAIAETFAREGADLILVDRLDASEISRTLENRGVRSLALQADVSSSAQVREAVQEALGRFGRIDILVNNAGVLRESYLVDTEEALWDLLLAVNLKSVYLFAKEVAPGMIARREGCILNASSFAGLLPSAGHGAYAAAKAGVISLTRTLAGELGPYNVRVLAYVPGVIETDLSRELVRRGRAQVLGTIPLGRLGTAQDVAEAVVWMAGRPAGYLSGSVIEISGGKLAVQNVAQAQSQAALRAE